MGCISLFIIGDIYTDNGKIIESGLTTDTQMQIFQESEFIEPAVPSTASATSAQAECKNVIQAYKSQIASDNDQISKSIVEKYNECMGISTKTNSQEKKEVKVDKVKTVKEKKK